MIKYKYDNIFPSPNINSSFNPENPKHYKHLSEWNQRRNTYQLLYYKWNSKNKRINSL
jgi:hypothetical protein